MFCSPIFGAPGVGPANSCRNTLLYVCIGDVFPSWDSNIGILVSPLPEPVADGELCQLVEVHLDHGHPDEDVQRLISLLEENDRGG